MALAIARRSACSALRARGWCRRASGGGVGVEETVDDFEHGALSLLSRKTDGSGLQYVRNRYYDPATGKFTQADPIGLSGGMNLYGFAGGDPVNYSDPFGLWPIVPWNGGAISVGSTIRQYLDEAAERANRFAVDAAGSARDLVVGGAVGKLIGGVIGRTSRAASVSDAEIAGSLRLAARGKGDFGVGALTRTEADLAGRAWVGEGAALASDGRTLISATGLRVSAYDVQAEPGEDASQPGVAPEA